MPIIMYDKTTGNNVKVYGFVLDNLGMYGEHRTAYAVTYQLSAEKQLKKALEKNTPLSYSAEDLELKLVPARHLRPLDT